MAAAETNSNSQFYTVIMHLTEYNQDRRIRKCLSCLVSTLTMSSDAA